MRMTRQVGPGVDGRKGNFRSGKLPRQKLGIRGARDRSDPAVGFGAAFDTRAIGGEAGIGGEACISQNLFGEHAPFAIVLDAEKDLGTVARWKRAVRRDRRMRSEEHTSELQS